MPSDLTITVVLKNCTECRYIDHSGAFTIRGARNICRHDDAKENFPTRTKEEFWEEYPEYKKRDGDIPDDTWRYHWYNRIIPDINKIPDCCPLKHGSGY